MIEQLGNLGEFISSIAVLISVVYLAMQIRQNTASVVSASRESMGQTIIDVNSQLFVDADSTRVWNMGRTDLSSLSPLEQARFSGFVICSLLAAENAMFQAQSGFLDEQYSDRNERWISWLAAQPGFVELWPGIAHFFTEDFQEAWRLARLEQEPD